MRLPYKLVATFMCSILIQGYSAVAQATEKTFPERPLHIVCPWSTGGGCDVVARLVGKHLTELVGQPVIIDNRPGAGGNIGASEVARSKPDGYTMLSGQLSVMALNPLIYKNAGFDPIKDFKPVTRMYESPMVIVVASDSPYKTMQEVIDKARSNPEELTYASPGSGTISHLTGAILDSKHDVKMLHIPYKGSAPALTALLGGQVDVLITSPASAQRFVQGDKARVLAVVGSERISLYPDAPTLLELGFEDMGSDGWFGLLVPASTPDDVVSYLQENVNTVMKMPEVQAFIEALGGRVITETPEDFNKVLQRDVKHWTEIINDAGLAGQ